jgi:hypothetical protein
MFTRSELYTPTIAPEQTEQIGGNATTASYNENNQRKKRGQVHFLVLIRER